MPEGSLSLSLRDGSRNSKEGLREGELTGSMGTRVASVGDGITLPDNVTLVREVELRH